MLGVVKSKQVYFLTPSPCATMVMASLAGYLIEHVHAGLLGALGLFIIAAGLFSLVLLPRHLRISILSSDHVLWRWIWLVESPNNHTVLPPAPRERRGGASGMLGTARLWVRVAARRWWR
ncbi:hypothetical protein ACNKHR_25275 [Shigella flexneri]